jgi:hypothetical protein
MTLRIIGAGFGRTGTVSLQRALEELGVAPCYHMFEIAKHPEHAAAWLAASRGDRIDWRRLLMGYAGAVDWPACVLWRELLAEFPDARVILTVRDAASWYASFCETILPRVVNLPPIQSLSMHALYDVGREVILRRTFAGRAGEAADAISVYEAHNAEVVAELKGPRLLVYDVAEGWPPLCAFLGVPVPATPFPRVNARAEFATALRGGVLRGEVTPTRS